MKLAIVFVLTFGINAAYSAQCSFHLGHGVAPLLGKIELGYQQKNFDLVPGKLQASCKIDTDMAWCIFHDPASTANSERFAAAQAPYPTASTKGRILYLSIPWTENHPQDLAIAYCYR